MCERNKPDTAEKSWEAQKTEAAKEIADKRRLLPRGPAVGVGKEPEMSHPSGKDEEQLGYIDLPKEGATAGPLSEDSQGVAISTKT